MPESHLRASDADRQAAVTSLQRHYADGRLSTEELRQRVQQALHSRTYADLEALHHDLPPLPPEGPIVAATGEWLAATPSGQRAAAPLGVGVATAARHSRADRKRALQLHVSYYALVNLGLIIIWLLTTPGGYFWPVWPMVGWGIGLGSHAIAYYFGRDHNARSPS